MSGSPAKIWRSYERGDTVTAYIGTAGWSKPQWRGGFYPSGLSQKEWLGYASRRLTSLEINGTYRRLQHPETFQKWRDETPDGFVFSVKAFALATVSPHLKNIEKPIERFLASGVLELGEKLGPILWQFPEVLEYDRDEVERFIGMLPPIRHAFEVRNASFAHDDFFELARAHNIAVVATNAVDQPSIRVATADFGYARLDSDEEHFAEGYDDDALDEWAGWVRASTSSASGGDTYVYFKNPGGVLTQTPSNAVRLMEILAVSTGST
jgi:uncharacterized protein YecE (DUF72 family)